MWDVPLTGGSSVLLSSDQPWDCRKEGVFLSISRSRAKDRHWGGGAIPQSLVSVEGAEAGKGPSSQRQGVQSCRASVAFTATRSGEYGTWEPDGH